LNITEIIKKYENKSLLLPIEVVPQSSHYNNLRYMMSSYQWSKLRKLIIPALNNKCIICSGSSHNRSLDLHEVWSYDMETSVQKLVALEGLCTHCHDVKHYYLSNMKGKYKKVRNRLKKINNFTNKEVYEYELYTRTMFNIRSKMEWKLDVSFIEDTYDFQIKK